jgi:hypothetical protein
MKIIENAHQQKLPTDPNSPTQQRKHHRHQQHHDICHLNGSTRVSKGNNCSDLPRSTSLPVDSFIEAAPLRMPPNTTPKIMANAPKKPSTSGSVLSGVGQRKFNGDLEFCTL